MARRAKTAKPTTNGRSEHAELLRQLWEAAVKLRGSIEPSDYKRYVLPLIFLRFLSARYEQRREELRTELRDHGEVYDTDVAEALLDDPDKANVFPIPEIARWSYLRELLLSKLNPVIPRVWLPEPGLAHTNVCSTEFLVCVPTAAPASYLYCLFGSEDFRLELCGLVTGTSNSHQRVRPGDFEKLKTAHPSDDVLAAFDAMAAPLLELMLANRRASRTLAELRDLLLPKLLFGELRMRQAEQAVEAAL